MLDNQLNCRWIDSQSKVMEAADPSCHWRIYKIKRINDRPTCKTIS